MAFNSTSYFVGIGTAFAAIAIGFAGGAMITTSAVQPPNRLEQVAAGKALPPSSNPTNSIASSNKAPEVSSPTAPTAQEPTAQTAATAPSPPPAVVAAAPSAPAADPPPVQQPQPAPVPVVKSPALAPVVKNEDPAPARNERASARPADPNREAARSIEPNKEPSRKKIEERKFSEDRKLPERRRRPDLQELDEVSNVVRRMPRDAAVDEVVERDDAPRLFESPRPRIGLFGN
jgi:hypothetical protein